MTVTKYIPQSNIPENSESTTQSTSALTPATSQEIASQPSFHSKVESTTVVSSATSQEIASQPSFHRKVESTTVVSSATSQEIASQPSFHRKVESTTVVSSATNQESTTNFSSETDVQSSSQFVTPTNAVHSSLSTEYYTTGVTSYYTSYVTVTAETTKVVTLTSCANDVCHKTTATTGVTVVTLSTSDIQTVLTTYAPLTQTVTLGITGSATFDLGCPTGHFGYKGYIGKGVEISPNGIKANANAGFNVGFDAIKRDQKVVNSTNVTVQSSKNAGAINSIYSSIELLCAVTAIMALIF